jgi:hypothetical protein
MLEAFFCLYAAWLLIEIRYAGYSRLFPHWCKGCFGHVCSEALYSGETVRALLMHSAHDPLQAFGRAVSTWPSPSMKHHQVVNTLHCYGWLDVL